MSHYSSAGCVAAHDGDEEKFNDDFLVTTVSCGVAGLCNLCNSRMLRVTVTLGERKCRAHCRLPSSVVKNGTSVLFGFMN